MKNLHQHTLGEWRVSGLPEFRTDRRIYNVVTMDGEEVIAKCSDFPRSEETAKANAFLIAAAPELLDALASLYRAIEENAGRIGINLNPQLYYAQKAIVKATNLTN